MGDIHRTRQQISFKRCIGTQDTRALLLNADSTHSLEFPVP